MKRFRNQHGQTSSEYLGVLTAIVVLIGVLAAGGPEIGTLVRDDIKAVLCRIAGGNCGSPADPYKPTEPCKVSSSSHEITIGGKLLFFQAEKGLAYTREVNSDGTVTLTIGQPGKGGLTAGEGASGKIDLGKHRWEAGAGVSAEANLLGDIQRKYKFANDKEADQFVKDVIMSGAFDEVAPESIPLPLQVPQKIGKGALWLGRKIIGADDIHIPKPDSIFYAAGVDAKIGGAVGAPWGGYASGEISGGHLLGVEEFSNGDRAFSYKANLEAKGETGLFIVQGPHADGSVESVIEFTYDKDGNPKNMKITVAGAGSADLVPAGFDLEAKGLDKFVKGLGEGALKGSTKDESLHELSVDLDLTDPNNRDAAFNWLKYGTNPLLPLKDGVNPLDAWNDLSQRLGQNGKWSWNKYHLDEFDVGAEGEVADVAKAGAKAGYKHKSQNLENSWYRVPGRGWVERPDC